MPFNRIRDLAIESLEEQEAQVSGLVQAIGAVKAVTDGVVQQIANDPPGAAGNFEPGDIGEVNQRVAAMKASIQQAAAGL